MNRNTTLIIGGKWGDEGKGKVASWAAKDADLVIRGTGGANAGHTIVFNGKKIALHLVPGGIVYPQTLCLIGQGVVLDIPVLLKEIEDLEKMEVPEVRSRLRISGRTHIVFQYHKDLDELHEKLKGKSAVGTTKRGIGPAYSDKDNRVGIRVYDLLLPVEKLEEKIRVATKLHNQAFKQNGMEHCCVDAKKVAEEYKKYGEIIKDMIVNADVITQNAIQTNKKIVVEGAQAYRLDKDYGDYPMVTSSNCVTAGTLVGAHIPHSAVKEVIVIAKAYDSRVGNGPFPTEQPAHLVNDKITDYVEPYIGDVIREIGHEYGSTTGRGRRVGFFDSVILKTGQHILGADYLCINHLDSLGKIGKEIGDVKICVAYNYQGRKIDYYPDDMDITGEIPTPIYISLAGGWDISSDIRDFDMLPEKAQKFIKLIEQSTGIPVKFIGVGPDNEDLIVRNNY